MNRKLSILHVVGGVSSRGGVMGFVRSVATSPHPDLSHLVWKHRDYQEEAHLPCVREGIVRDIDHSLASDFVGAFRESFRLRRWLREHPSDIIHAHSRMGILATSLVRRPAKTALYFHVHALANRPQLYHRLARQAGAAFVFNSAKSCRHFGCDPGISNIVMPPIEWPQSAASPARESRIRFCAAGEYVRSKHFDLLLEAFARRPASLQESRLVIWGRSDRPLDAIYQARLEQLASNIPGVELKAYDPKWADHLSDSDIFVHLGEPESFGIVVLQAFSRGCRMAILEPSFLSELPCKLHRQGVTPISEVSVLSILRVINEASSAALPGLLFEGRRELAQEFSPARAAQLLSEIYKSPSSG